LFAVVDKALWDIFWLIVLLASVSILIRQRTVQAAMLFWLLLAPLGIYLASYLLSAWPDYIAHIDTSLPRLLIQLCPVGWLLIALAISPQIDVTQPMQPEPQPNARSARGTDCS
jgi:hypothetical protein